MVLFFLSTHYGLPHDGEMKFIISSENQRLVAYRLKTSLTMSIQIIEHVATNRANEMWTSTRQWRDTIGLQRQMTQIY